MRKYTRIWNDNEIIECHLLVLYILLYFIIKFQFTLFIVTCYYTIIIHNYTVKNSFITMVVILVIIGYELNVNYSEFSQICTVFILRLSECIYTLPCLVMIFFFFLLDIFLLCLFHWLVVCLFLCCIVTSLSNLREGRRQRTCSTQPHYSVSVRSQ